VGRSLGPHGEHRAVAKVTRSAASAYNERNIGIVELWVKVTADASEELLDGPSAFKGACPPVETTALRKAARSFATWLGAPFVMTSRSARPVKLGNALCIVALREQ
jgi:hypothetical protein